MDIIRTPEDRFHNLDGYDFEPHYIELTAADDTPLRMHYLDEGASTGDIILCLHGQPSWSYLYRKMIPTLVAQGHRVIAPDLIGFGKSDKPTARSDYTYQAHVDWLTQFIQKLDLSNITLVCQDWGGLLGLRVAGFHSERFARLVIANTGLPDTVGISDEVSELLGSMEDNVPVPDAAMVAAKFSEGAPDAFLYWVKFAGEATDFSARNVFEMLSGIEDPAVLDGYNAPFPDEAYMAGARQFPSLVPLLPRHKPEREINTQAWQGLEAFERPVLLAFSDDDPVTKGGDATFLARVPGAAHEAHVTIKGGGHFLQEMQPEAFSQAINNFIAANPIN